MTGEQIGVLMALVGLIAALLTTKIKPAYCFGLVALLGFVAEQISLPDLMANFTNASLITLVLLIVISAALEKTRFMGWVGQRISQGKHATVVTKLGLSTAILSSFTNNTAVVVSLIGAVKRNQRHAPSRLLLPLSYTAILGGTLTLIGTSTNLIINSFVERAGLPSLGFFAPTLIGLAVLLAGLLVLVPLSHWLPHNDNDQELDLPYFLEGRVTAGSPLIGKTIKENGLRHLRRLYLAEVIRDGQTIVPISPDTLLTAQDRLLFCGDVESVSSLQDIEGLNVFGQCHLNGQNFHEVVVSQSSSICGKTLKATLFRERFDAVVVAIRRGHERLAGGLGLIELQAGDVLVLVPGSGFHQQREALEREFVQINGLDSSARLDTRKSVALLGGFLAVIALALVGVISLVKGLILFLVALVLSKILSLDEMKRRFPMDIVVIVGSALSLAQWMMSSGLSDLIGQGFLSLFGGIGLYGALIAVYLLTLILTELITNNAAAALAFPIAYSLSISYHSDPMPFIMALLFGASASFISPYGYQTNLLVYRIGHYQLKDYFRLGLPLSVVYSVVVLALIPYFFPF